MLYNQERLHSLMDQFGIDAIVAATPENIFYLSGFTSWSQGAYKYGNTIGLEAREFPFIFGPAEKVDDPFLPDTTDVPLEPGMTINLEASYHEFGWGTVHAEYPLAVTDKGSEYLSSPEQQKLHWLPLV